MLSAWRAARRSDPRPQHIRQEYRETPQPRSRFDAPGARRGGPSQWLEGDRRNQFQRVMVHKQDRYEIYGRPRSTARAFAPVGRRRL